MDDPFAQGTAYGLKDKLEAGGIKTVVDEVYPPNTTDFSSIAAKIADTKADMVVGGTQYQDAVNLIVALQQLNYQPKMAAFSTAPTNPEFPAGDRRQDRGHPLADRLHPGRDVPVQRGVRRVLHRAQRHPARRGRGQRLDHRPGRRRGRRGRRLRRPGAECQQKLIDWLHENEVDTVVGPLSWDEDGRPQSAHLIQQYVDGKIQIVLPEDQAEADLVSPKPAW